MAACRPPGRGFVVLVDAGSFVRRALQLVALLSTSLPWMLLNVKLELNPFPPQTNKIHLESI